MHALLLVLAAAAAHPVVDGQIRVDPFISSTDGVRSGALVEAQVGARAGDMRVQLRLAPVELVGRDGTDARVGGYMLGGFESDDLELSVGLGRVLPFGPGALPEDVDVATFAWFVRMGRLDRTSFSFLGAHGIPSGPIFADADALLQLALTSEHWLLLRAGTFLGGYAVAEVGLRSRVITRPGGGGTYVRWTAGVHALGGKGYRCSGDLCFPLDERSLSPSLSLGLEWR
jgi:hypothetical protein